MPVCPACEADNLPGSAGCRRCGLSTELFEPIRAAVGLPKGDPRYETQVRELIEALGDLALGEPDSVSGRMARATPARSVPPPPTGNERGAEVATLALHTLPSRPRLPEPGGVAELRRLIDEYLGLARADDPEGYALTFRARELAGVTDEDTLDRFATELFVRVAADLTVSYGAQLARRTQWAQLLPTPTVDRALDRARSLLAQGELAQTHREILGATEALDHLDEEWGPAEVLLQAAEDLEGAIRELGGDPTAALGPITEGRRLLRELEREGSEALLSRGTVGLWTILNPILEKDLAHRIEEVRAQRLAGAHVDPVLTDLREFASQVKKRNFSAAVAFYRRGVDRLARLADPVDAPAPALNIDPSVRPA
ncbi:MAG: hypothetical protein L3J95_01220 [Thermoplasmata archaeon]|nr:hypothetical protein [Thermoplasmata archaeon]MCI4359037.1 hypothetical protein [Thermoplasmata archaeon]